MLRFDNRVERFDLRSDKFLTTLVQLGGYCTLRRPNGWDLRTPTHELLLISEFLKRTGLCGECSVIRSFTRRPRPLLGCWEKIGGPGAYTMTKTVLNRLLAVDFYLEDVPNADFVFEHERKIAVLTQQGCPMGMIPQRGGRPCLWDEFLLKVADGTITIAQVNDQGRGTFSQAKNLAIRFSEVTKYLPQCSSLSIVTGSKARERSYDRVLKHPDMQQVHACCGIPVTTSLIDASGEVPDKHGPIHKPKH